MKKSLKRYLPRMSRTSKGLLLLVAAILLAAATFVGVAMAQQPSSKGPLRRGAAAGDSRAVTASVINQIASNRVASISLQGSTVVVTGTASDSGADLSRTLWYEGVAGVAFAQGVRATTLTRNVEDANGAVIDTESDALTPGFSAATVTTTAATLSSELTSRAPTVDASIDALNYVPLLGGTGEVVVQPNDASAFLSSAGENLASLLGPIGQNHGAYLVTVVDSSQSPELVLGYVPGIGGYVGQGLGWQAPGVQSDAINEAPRSMAAKG